VYSSTWPEAAVAVARRACARAAGDWDGFSRPIDPVGAAVLDRIDLRPGLDLLDLGTGSRPLTRFRRYPGA
jgi:hypothetical protein